MKLTTSALLLLALLTPTITFAQADCDYKPVSRGWAITGEAAGAVMAGYGLGAFSTTGLFFVIRPHVHEQEWGDLVTLAMAAVLSGITVVPAGSALGAHAMGAMMHTKRQFWPGLLGGYCGMAAEVGLMWVVTRSDIGSPLTALALALPPAGAVIGYNMGRPTGANYGGFEQRLEMPRMAMTMTRDGLNRPVPGVRCDLVTLRF